MSLLAVRDLTVTERRSGTALVRGVGFTLEAGVCLGLVGESGSGKSLTCLSLLGLTPPTLQVRGSALLDGQELLTASPKTLRHIRGRRVALVVQQPMTAFDPLCTVGAQIWETLRAVEPGQTAGAARECVWEALESLRLKPAEVLDKYPWQLSGGMLQRIMVAMALLARPGLIIADEPTTALDAMNQREVVAQFRWLQEQCGAALIFISHDLGVVREIAQNLVVMKDGRVVEAGRVELLAAPAHACTRYLASTRAALSSAFEQVMQCR